MCCVSSLLERIPLLGYILGCNCDNHRESFAEWLSTVFISLLPFIVGFFVILWGKEGENKIITSIVYDNIRHGELFVYCCSLVAPIFSLSLMKKRGWGTYPYRLFMVIIFVIVITLSTVFFTMEKVKIALDLSNVLKTSVFLFLLSVVSLYVSLVLHNSRVDPSGEFRRQEKNYTAGYGQHRG